MRAVEAVDRCTREDAGGTDGDGSKAGVGTEGRGQRERGEQTTRNGDREQIIYTYCNKYRVGVERFFI